MADVFVSYAHLNRGRVETIANGLKQAGFSLWWDDHLNVGADFTLEIERELAAAKCVVVAWSTQARNSLWVRAEATEALDNGKLLQLRLDGVKPPLPFTIVQMLDLSRWRGERGELPWPQVEAGARAMAGGNVQPADPQTFEGPALQDFGGTAMIGWLSLALVIFMAALTIQLVEGGVGVEVYGVAASASFGLSCVGLLTTLLRVVRTAAASRRT